VHNRKIDLEKANGSVKISDEISGNGRHSVSSFIHLHPDVEIAITNHTLHLTRDGIRCRVECPDIRPELESGWYSPHFGEKIHKSVIVLRLHTTLPSVLQYIVSPVL
jgi:uncharacterized heparinase superfamily protein